MRRAASTSIKPRAFTLTFVRSRPGIAEFGRRPTDTSTRSNVRSLGASAGSPSPSNVTASPSFASFRPTTLVLRSTASDIDSIRRARILTRSRSAPGSSPLVISTTVTFVPSAAYTVPNSSPMYPPPTTSSDLGMSGISSAPVESIRRGLSRVIPGTVDGRDPVAMIACSNVRVSDPDCPSLVISRL